MQSDLVLPLKAEYFYAIKDGTKDEEYRLCTPFWKKRLEGKSFGRVVLTLGYPSRIDGARRLVRPWQGMTVKTITHPHFGPDPVEVFAINVAAASLARRYHPTWELRYLGAAIASEAKT